MTTQEMIIQFNTLKDLYQAPYYDTDDILLMLNRSALAFVDALYPHENTRTLMGSHGGVQRSTDSIHTIIETEANIAITTPSTAFHSRAKAHIELPEDYRHFETLELKWGTTYPNKITVKTWDEINQVFADPFSTPNNTENVYLVWHGSKILLFSATAPTWASLIYCKHPAEISLSTDCDLPELVHPEIVKLAVKMAMAIAEEKERAALNTLIQ